MAGKDILFILDALGPSPADGGPPTYCRDCMEVEGLLAMFPELAVGIEVIRVPWTRPREAVVEAIGEENQNCPALVFAEGGFVNDQEGLLAALHERHGFPVRNS